LHTVLLFKSKQPSNKTNLKILFPDFQDKNILSIFYKELLQKIKMFNTHSLPMEEITA